MGKLIGMTHQYTPLNHDPQSTYQTETYGDVHLQGRRPSQEDGGLYVLLPEPLELTPYQVAERLWTAIKTLDEAIIAAELSNPYLNEQGSTACITCLHQNHLISANLADSVLFVVLYSAEGQLLGAKRLTTHLHKASDAEEQSRIAAEGGQVFGGRVYGNLAIARGLGDHYCNQTGEVVSSDAALGLYSLAELQTLLNPSKTAIGKMQFILSCDGFTEAADRLAKTHQDYLIHCLNRIKDSANLQESALAKALATESIAEGSTDNVSIEVMTLDPSISNTRYFALFDGHGGQLTVDFVVNHFATIFNQQLSLTEDAYQQQALSTQHKKASFLRDNAFLNDSA